MVTLTFENAPTKDYKLNADKTISKKSSSSSSSKKSSATNISKEVKTMDSKILNTLNKVGVLFPTLYGSLAIPNLVQSVTQFGAKANADRLEEKAKNVARANDARQAIAEEKQEKDILTTNFFEKLFGQQSEAEKNFLKQLQDTIGAQKTANTVYEKETIIEKAIKDGINPSVFVPTASSSSNPLISEKTVKTALYVVGAVVAVSILSKRL